MARTGKSPAATCVRCGRLQSHLLYLVFEHTLDFAAHGFGACIAEMDAHLVGGLTDFLYQRGASSGALAG